MITHILNYISPIQLLKSDLLVILFQQNTSGSLVIIIVLSVIAIVSALLAISFYLKLKKIRDIKKDDLSEEFNSLKQSYNTLKKTLLTEQEQAELLREQIKGFQVHINKLEDINTSLLEQKLKLQTAKQNLEELQTQKDELFAIAIHDIKNPVSAIKGYIELIQGYDLNAQEQQEIMINLAQSSDQIVKLAIEITKVMARQKPVEMLKFEKNSLKKIIDSVCGQNYAYAKKKGVKLINQSSDSLPLMKIDKEKIAEAIENIINNAIKYAPENTVVQLRTFFNNSCLTIEVSDNGVGLSADDVKKAFIKGSVLTPKPTGNEESTGLGLWIVKKIVDEHNGEVLLKSKPGIGSTFSINLPIDEN